MSDVLAQLTALSDADWAGANPLSLEFRDDPYPALKALREFDPVNQTPIGPWRISRYTDIVETLKVAPISMTRWVGYHRGFSVICSESNDLSHYRHTG